MEAATPITGDLLEGGELSLRLLSGAPRGLPAEAMQSLLRGSCSIGSWDGICQHNWKAADVQEMDSMHGVTEAAPQLDLGLVLDQTGKCQGKGSCVC